MEDNLRMRAARAVAKWVERGRVVGLGASQGVFVSVGKAWGGVGAVDGAFGRNGMITFRINLIFVPACIFCVLLCRISLRCTSPHNFFGETFESGDSDHIVVSGALNNPGIDSLFVQKVLMVALEESFV